MPLYRSCFSVYSDAMMAAVSTQKNGIAQISRDDQTARQKNNTQHIRQFERETPSGFASGIAGSRPPSWPLYERRDYCAPGSHASPDPTG